jgi:hypothetical protein
MAACLTDERQAGKIAHPRRELLQQRVYGIACGYPNANDAGRLAKDPIHKLLLGRDPIEGTDLASQPTLSRRSGKTERVYAETHYAAGTWSHRRRVILKAEVVREPGKDPKDNPRFVVTNQTPSHRWIYERVYGQRGDVENRIKELPQGLQIDRTRCTDFWAKQFRVLLTAAAFVLLQELRLRAARTQCARAPVWTLRERLLKLGARVLRSVRRVVVHLPASFPFLASFRQIALALDARPG